MSVFVKCQAHSGFPSCAFSAVSGGQGCVSSDGLSAEPVGWRPRSRTSTFLPVTHTSCTQMYGQHTRKHTQSTLLPSHPWASHNSRCSTWRGLMGWQRCWLLERVGEEESGAKSSDRLSNRCGGGWGGFGGGCRVITGPCCSFFPLV